MYDSGATHHMTGFSVHFSTVEPISTCLVKLPNGDSVPATKAGSVCLSDRLTPHNVMFVLGLQCNLISVFQLVRLGNCHTFFTDELCFVQDWTSGKVIGEGEQSGGLYFFRETVSAAAVSVTDPVLA